MYTIETLTEFNQDQPNVLPITAKDVEIVNTILDSLANNLTDQLPCVGDNVVMHGERWNEGRTARVPQEYTNGHCEGKGYKPDTMNLCTQPMSPYIAVSKDGKRHGCSTSGGYWVGSAPIKDIIYTGETYEKLFWTWGSRGAGGHMGLYFMATVKKMQYTDLENIY